MEETFCAEEITIGFHPKGYRIDKTTSPGNWYTQWDIVAGNRWCHPQPVPFAALPREGWIGKDRFDWQRCLSNSMESVG